MLHSRALGRQEGQKRPTRSRRSASMTTGLVPTLILAMTIVWCVLSLHVSGSTKLAEVRFIALS